MSIIIAAIILADVICFVNGYRSYIFGAVTPEEKRIRLAKLRKLEIEAGMAPSDAIETEADYKKAKGFINWKVVILWFCIVTLILQTYKG